MAGVEGEGEGKKLSRASLRPFLPLVRPATHAISDLTKYVVILYLTGLLLLFGAYLAWETRKVHISALNDSKLIGLSVYNVIIPCILVIPILGIVFDQPTIQFALISFLTIFCTTFTLCFVFVPKVSQSMETKP